MWNFIREYRIGSYRIAFRKNEKSLLEEFHLLGYKVMQSGESQSMFRSNILLPLPWSNNKPTKKIYQASSRQSIASCRLPETSVDFKRTAQHYIPAGRTLRSN
jgi:hypothetical protein